jgi:hypothetical protein
MLRPGRGYFCIAINQAIIATFIITELLMMQAQSDCAKRRWESSFETARLDTGAGWQQWSLASQQH